VFPGVASFDRAAFSGDASFESAAFSGDASFESAAFSGDAWFESAAFSGDASFESAAFSGDAWFVSAAFSGDASFDSAAFSGDARFDSAAFSGNARFVSAAFSGDALFGSAAFSGNARFVSAAFSGDARFDSAAFSGDASFVSAAFSGDVRFDSAAFSGDADFSLAHFKQSASFNRARFEAASFEAMRGERGFSMADAVFEAVPDFIQAHFQEAPRLDNLQVKGRWIARHERPKRDEAKTPWAKGRRAALHAVGRARTLARRAAWAAWRRLTEEDRRNIPARWRALKRLAIQGEDTDRELDFHAREIESERFTDDWPLPFAFWSVAAWSGCFRFWFGLFYGFASNFGRSLARPALFWLAAVAAGAAFYLSQTAVLQRDLDLRSVSYVAGTFETARYALSHEAPCYPPPPTPFENWRAAWRLKNGAKAEPAPDPNANRIDGLTAKFRAQTNARAEALHLAFRNAFIVLDGSSEAAHRSYGCLYGVELYGGSNPIAVVPSAVSTVSAAQKLFSGLMIFLFGLALRNMLKVK
jgi:hypothetical protein